jgi:hypothetical protein
MFEGGEPQIMNGAPGFMGENQFEVQKPSTSCILLIEKMMELKS